jgi:hypothetical protein
VKERCDHNLVEVVSEYQKASGADSNGVSRGLPPHDVVMLAFMLLEGVTTVHEYAKSLHLHVQPLNVLTNNPLFENGERSVASGPQIIKLADEELNTGRVPVALAKKIAAGLIRFMPHRLVSHNALTALAGATNANVREGTSAVSLCVETNLQ